MDLPEIETRYPWFTESFSRTASSMVDISGPSNWWIPEFKDNPLPSSSVDEWTGDPTVLFGVSVDWVGYTESGFAKSREGYLSLDAKSFPEMYGMDEILNVARMLEQGGRVAHSGFKVYDLYSGRPSPSSPVGGMMLVGGNSFPKTSVLYAVQLEVFQIYGPGPFDEPTQVELVEFIKQRLGNYVVENYYIGIDLQIQQDLTSEDIVYGIEELNEIGATIGYPILGDEIYGPFSPGDTVLVVVREGGMQIFEPYADPVFQVNLAWLSSDIYKVSGVPSFIDYELGSYETKEGVVQVAEINGAQFIKSFIGIKPDGTNASLYGWVSNSPIDTITFDDMIYAKLGRTRPLGMRNLVMGPGSVYTSTRFFKGTGLDFFNGGSYSRFPGGGFRRGKMGLG